MKRFLLLATAAVVRCAAIAQGAYVDPQLGGGSPGANAAMKHADVWLDSFGTLAVDVTIDASISLPRLRPLIDPDEFDPAAGESVLNGKAYNAQYGWNPNGFIQLPAGSAFWIEPTGSSDGLEVYQAAPESPEYAPIFGTAGSSPLWKWSTTRMVHNYYAAEDFTRTRHWASYRVYVGHASTAEPVAGYTAAEVLFEFAPPGDYNADGVVDPSDYELWRTQYGHTGVQLEADGNGDGLVDARDYTVWRWNAAGRTAGVVPEPGALSVLVLGLVAVCRWRRRG